MTATAKLRILLQAILGLAATAQIPELAADEHPTAGPESARARGWQCNLCPQANGWKGEVEAGSGWVSDASLKFGDYRGLPESESYPALGGDIHYRDDDGSFLDLRVRDLGIESRSIDLRGGERGRYSLNLAYREIPKYRGFGTRTAYLGSGGAELTLPADWQSSGSTSGMGSLSTSLNPLELKTARRTLDLGLRWRLDPAWTYDLQFQHQSKQGTRPYGAGVFTINSSHFPAPVNFSTNRLDMGLSHAGQTTNWRLGFSGSKFNNAHQSITWPNPFTPIPGTELLRASLEPDNSLYQLNGSGTWKPAERLCLSGMAVLGQMEQDDPLLPPSTNPGFSDVPLPRVTAATRINAGALNLAGNLNARLSPHLSLNARLRREERDNRTPVGSFTPIITDIAQREPQTNRPLSFQRDRASVALRYRAHRVVRLQAGADLEHLERSLQSVPKTSERRYWGEISLSPGTFVKLRLRGEQSDRRAAPYSQLEFGGLIEHPLMRKFHLADRKRDRWRLDVDWLPTPGLTLSVSYQGSEDDYAGSIVGLHESKEHTLSLDAGWTISDGLQVYAFISRDDIDSGLAGAESPLVVPWLAQTMDTFRTAGGSIQTRIGDRASVALDLIRADSVGGIQVAVEAGGGRFPGLRTNLSNARLRLDFSVNESWGIIGWLEYEAYESSDWSLDGLGPDGIPAILTFGKESPDYSVTVLGVRALYRF